MKYLFYCECSTEQEQDSVVVHLNSKKEASVLDWVVRMLRNNDFGEAHNFANLLDPSDSIAVDRLIHDHPGCSFGYKEIR